MAIITQNVGVENVTADILDNELNLANAIPDGDGNITCLVTITAVVGTGIAFGLGSAVGGYQWPVNSKFWFTYRASKDTTKPNILGLYFKKSNVGDKFVVTV